MSNQQYVTFFQGQLEERVGKKPNDQLAIRFAAFDKTEYAILAKKF